ncbi:hypothetical protein DALLNEIH_03664 [Bacillus sp. B01(2024)]|uniref:hypothetical protein n=1 Tax=Bacillus siamensis TaxID=659243 RepID=UPI0039E16F92
MPALAGIRFAEMWPALFGGISAGFDIGLGGLRRLDAVALNKRKTLVFRQCEKSVLFSISF